MHPQYIHILPPGDLCASIVTAVNLRLARCKQVKLTVPSQQISAQQSIPNTFELVLTSCVGRGLAMAQLANLLPRKHEHLSLDPQHPCKKPGMEENACNSSTGKTENPWGSLAEIMDSKTLSQKIKGTGI